MKRIFSLIVAGLAALMLLGSCAESLDEGKDLLPLDGELRFRFAIPGQTLVETKAIDPDGERISSLWLFLFDGDGYYEGRVMAHELTYGGADEKGNATGRFSVSSIPGTVRRIHFVANFNAAASIDDSELLHLSEAEVMTRFATSSGRLVYWGRTELDAAPTAEVLEGEEPIMLYRNQASVTYAYSTEPPQGSAGLFSDNYEILGFAIINAYAKGTVAPFNPNGSGPFDFPPASDHSDDYVTMCSGGDLIKATDPTDIVGLSEGGMLYTFEHPNREDDPLSVIFKIRSKDDKSEKYYRLMIVDEELNTFPVVRNHRYRFNFKDIPTTLGYDTFEEAKNGVAANNVWVSIDDDLPSVGDGNTTLTVIGGTTRIITSQDDNTIEFTYKERGETGVSGAQPVAEWVSNDGLASEELEVTYNMTTGEGKVTLDLNPTTSDPQYGTLRIKAGQYVRTVRIIYLQEFEFTPVWTSSSVPDKKDQPISIVFNIPETYPAELFPVRCKISSNLFGLNQEQQLEVIEEETSFVVDGQQYHYDWDYKYVYEADGPGLHRIDFKTLVGDYGNDAPPEWFLEADYFKTIRREINMIDGQYADQQIIIYESKTGSYQRSIPPVKGYRFDLKFKLEGGTPDGTKVRIYMDENVEPGYVEGDNWQNEHLGPEQTAPDAGRYFIYTAGLDAMDSEGYFTIPFYTTTARSSGYARLAAADTDNKEPDHWYKSAIVTRVNEPEAYSFHMQLSTAQGAQYGEGDKTLELGYGTGNAVYVSIDPDINAGDVPEYIVPECRILLKTDALRPAGGAEDIEWSDEHDGYIFTFNPRTETRIEIPMLTDRVVSAGEITVSELDGNIAFYEDAVTVTNQPIEGSVTVEGLTGGFGTANPFFALEKSDGTRVGSFAVTAAAGGNTGSYVLTLLGEYDFSDDERLTVLYSRSVSGSQLQQIYFAYTTVRELLADPDPELKLILQQ